LQKAAQVIVETMGGVMPSTAKELKKLPGIGPYTACAVASIVFGEPVALVDGNVKRVLSRLTAMAVDPKEKRVDDYFWSVCA
jgi:A/G-specific adenine glycosylase